MLTASNAIIPAAVVATVVVVVVAAGVVAAAAAVVASIVIQFAEDDPVGTDNENSKIKSSNKLAQVKSRFYHAMEGLGYRKHGKSYVIYIYRLV